MDENIKTFVIYVNSLNLGSKMINPARKAHIAQILTKKVTMPSKYANFANVFLKKLAKVVIEGTDINEYTIELVVGKQPLHKPIYNLGLIKFEILKTYI